MEGALIILAALVVTGFILWLLDKRYPKEEPKPEETPAAEAQQPEEEPAQEHDAPGGVCCGQHLVCEKDTLSPTSAKIEYYDDEELDRFIGRPGTDYTDEETEEFQEVLLTLRPEDVVGWARSITQRHLELPPVVRDELLLLVNDARSKSRQ